MERKTDIVVGAIIINEDKLLLIHHKKTGKWLPPGGHIEANETPDSALKREVREELDIDIEFLEREELKTNDGENIVEELALPFYANVHGVGDHDHACFFYLCKPNHTKIKISPEIHDFMWVTKHELNKSDDIPSDVKKIGNLAFKKMKK